MHAVMVEAVEAAGGTVVPIEQASALIFADPAAADAFPNIIGAGPGVEWPRRRRGRGSGLTVSPLPE